MKEVNINVRNLKEKFEEGLESIIYYYTDPQYYEEDVLYKRFRSVEYIRNYNSDISIDMLRNKYEKILMIPSLNCLKDEVKLIDVGLEKNSFSGYTMRKSNLKPIKAKHKILNDNTHQLIYYKPDGTILTLEDKIKYLKLLREKIEKLNEMEIYIGDFNYENFLISNNLDKIMLCDLDNLKIWSHDFDNKTASVKTYENVCMNDKNNDNLEGLDSYCFNIFTLSLLLNQSNFTTLRNIDKIKLPEEFESYENNNIIESIKKLDKTYKPKFLIDKFR